MSQYHCRHAGGPIQIDGVLNEPDWQTEGAVRDCGLVGRSDARPSLFFEFRAVWDQDHLYVAFVSDASPVPVTMTGRDEALFNECAVELFIACDRRGVYEVEFNPLGAVLDMLNPQDGQDVPWPELARNHEVAGLQSAVGWFVDRACWTLEAALPFTSFPFAANRPWRCNFAHSQRLADGSSSLEAGLP